LALYTTQSFFSPVLTAILTPHYRVEQYCMPNITFWGVIASPFQLKMQSLADYADYRWQRRPDQASLFEAIDTLLRLTWARRTQTIERLPARISELDEYPAVPYYSLDGRQFFYDSSGLAHHLDQLSSATPALLPEEPQLRFICQLIDEAYDEFGLYMVHHNRWVVSAATNCMGAVTTREMRNLMPPGVRQLMARKLSKRQTQRCPYLFSVPPSREGFPPTHQLLDGAWRRYLAAMENVLQHQPFLLGQRFTLADASAYGQLSMNLIDGRAAELLEELAPLTFAWLCMIRDGGHVGSSGELVLSEHLLPLLEIISETFCSLMRQNEAAYMQAVSEGQTLFNEAAFDRDQALYDGTLLGMPFRAVAKSFQVPVWRDICRGWQELQDSDKESLQSIYPILADAEFLSL
jgi:glutathione S-transferase